MRNITLSADEGLIELARSRARSEHTTLNKQFRLWLEDYARRSARAAEAINTITELRQRITTGGRKFSRDEINER